jgi:multimeric flavodoxin WrbA
MSGIIEKVLVIGSSPNLDGLTARCVDAAVRGVTEAGVKAETVRLNDMNIGNCQACGNGWGTCLNDHVCQVEDDFQELHARCLQTDALVFVTPVYWGDLSEASKAFADRLRRCEATKGDASGLKGRPVIAVAAAGGSGNGMITCLASIERWIEHVRCRKYDFIPVNRWNQAVKLETIQKSATQMVQFMKEGV